MKPTEKTWEENGFLYVYKEDGTGHSTLGKYLITKAKKKSKKN